MLPELGIVRMVRRLLSGIELKVAVSCDGAPQSATAALSLCVLGMPVSYLKPFVARSPTLLKR